MSDGNNDDENTDYGYAYENGCADTAQELRATVGRTIQTRIDELEIQKREITCAINNLAQMKKLVDSALN